MGRLFTEHIKRQIQSLDGAWRFTTDKDNVGESMGWYNRLPKHEHMTIPSVWNTSTGLLKYEGVAWYQKSFYTDGGTLRFCFGAVMTEAKVWLDGNCLGSHYGGFSAFDFIARDVEQGFHTLTVRVDNSFDAQSIPQTWVDWYHHGGIVRSVTVETLKGISILQNRFEYTLNEALTSAECTVKATLYNADDKDREETLYVKIDESHTVSQKVLVEKGASKDITFEAFTIDNIELWDTENPKLYTVQFETQTDDLFDRVGFRKIEVTRDKLLLNKKAVEIRGVNRHEDHPDFGFAFPQSLMKRDVDLITNLGCNSIRGSHYPNSKEFVDLLDELGILFWSEIPIWGCGFSEEALADPVVVERGLAMHREMLEQYYNHPCIIIWGMHNEINSFTQPGYDMTKLYYDYLKQNGGNRAVVYATCYPMKDICLEFCDIICLNRYYGWYYGYEEGAWADFLAEFKAKTKELGVDNKPMIISEFGYGAVAGCHDDEGILWCEENQAKQLCDAIEVFHKDDAVIGYYIWQFCDVRTCLQAGISRARGFNNKGIMNEYRKPKLAYYAIRQLNQKYIDEERKS